MVLPADAGKDCRFALDARPAALQEAVELLEGDDDHAVIVADREVTGSFCETAGKTGLCFP